MSKAVIKKKNPGGRPSKYSIPIVAKLIEAFHNGFNIEEACQHAGIDKTSYYRWLENKPGFATKMTDAQTAVNKRSKVVVVQAIDGGDANSAKWWLERRDPAFKTKGELEVTPVTKNVRERIKEFLDEPNDEGADAPSTPALSAGSGGEEPDEVALPAEHLPE